MISALLATTAFAPAQRAPAFGNILELPGDPGRTVIEAVVPLPALDPYQRRMGEIAAGTVGEGSTSFTRGAAIDATLGDGVNATIIGDTLRLGIESETGDPATAILILADAILNPRFDQESLDEFAAQLDRSRIWTDEIYGADVDRTPPARTRIADFWRRYVYPSAMTVVFQGGFAAGRPTRLWREALAEYRRPDLRYEPVSTSNGRLRGEWTAAAGPDRPWRENGPSRLLAAFALGAGKGSAAFRALRRESGISYRQEFFWLPVKAGWRPVLAYRSGAEPDERSAAMEALKRTIGEWSESDRTRAIAMARAAYLGSAPWDPLSLVHREIGVSASATQAWRAAIWRAHNGADWSPEAMVRQLEGVDLEQMREAAMADLETMGGNR